MARKRPTTLSIGTISEGTLRPEDLILAYLNALEGLRLAKSERLIVNDARQWHENYRGMHSDRASEILTDLSDVIDAHVPDYCYFGTLEGDGACFGVWPSMESLENDWTPNFTTKDLPVFRSRDLPGRPIDMAVLQDHITHWAHINDHGNVTLYRRAGNRWIEVWSVV